MRKDSIGKNEKMDQEMVFHDSNVGDGYGLLCLYG